MHADESQASNGLRLGTNFLSDAENQNIVTLDSTKQETIPQKIWRIEALLRDPLEILHALIAVRIQPAVANWLLYAHRSAEPGHILKLNALKAETLLELGMRLGEGSGAGVEAGLCLA